MTPQQIDNIVYNQAVSMGVPSDTAKLIAAQARYETAGYTSNVFKNYNNAFGYKWVGQKKWASGPGGAAGSQDAQGNADGGTYAKYPSVAYSTGELVDWLKRRQAEGKLKISALKTPAQYAAALKASGYYGQTASQYASGLSTMLKYITIAAGGALTLLLLVAGFFF